MIKKKKNLKKNKQEVETTRTPQWNKIRNIRRENANDNKWKYAE